MSDDFNTANGAGALLVNTADNNTATRAGALFSNSTGDRNYDAVNAMLLNEFLKEHRKVEKLEASIALHQEQIEALTEGLQKVTTQIETKEPQSENRE